MTGRSASRGRKGWRGSNAAMGDGSSPTPTEGRRAPRPRLEASPAGTRRRPHGSMCFIRDAIEGRQGKGGGREGLGSSRHACSSSRTNYRKVKRLETFANALFLPPLDVSSAPAAPLHLRTKSHFRMPATAAT
eukprot:124088-Chlamydomonas_euryale.AAC.2